MWEHLKDQFQDLKATVMDAIMNIIQSQVIQAGIKWIMGLLTPVGAFVKAAMAIVDVVKFFIQRAAQIGELVKAFTQSVSAIASGKVGAVAASIENALGKAIPVLIGLLASILGISGLADKVLGVIRKIRQRITAGITKFWNFVKQKGKGLLGKVGIGKKEKEEKKVDDKKTDKKKAGDHEEGDFNGTKQFITPTGDKHTLYFEEKGNKDVLMMRSTPRTYENFIKTVEINNDDPKKVVAKQKLLSLIVEMKSLKNNDEKYELKMSKVFNEIYSLNQELFEVGQSSIPVFRGTTHGGFGDSMTIEYLTKVPHLGTKGSDTGGLKTPAYSSIDKRNRFYVRGHLLSQKLHGPGIWENLTPLSRSANSSHEDQIESTLKEGIEKNKAYHYHVQAIYGRNVNSNLLKQIANSDYSESEKEVLKDIIMNEQYVPTKLTAHAVEIDQETGKAKGKNVQLVSIVNDLKDTDLSEYKLNSTSKRGPVDLNKASEAELKIIFSPAIAKEIVTLREELLGFNSFKQLTSINYVSIEKLNKLASDDKIKL